MKKRSIVMKYHIQSHIDGERYSSWVLFTFAKFSKTGQNRHSIVRMTVNEARDYIEEHGLVRQVKNEHGEIYDTPEQSFKDLKFTANELAIMAAYEW